ncbi:Uncharacterised protein [Mycobacterium tuberculosis]|uniref:Uncharacterized protein n=2 Tax=Mycobacterium tuberculosis TaxID=1773 RepID=A0A655EDG3_MYCTX|nr:Uncharacterised protein [Mycobacterium tuberculosis]CKT10425.1 Uncharacterised protein [Mycobacterium tuberculosis]CNU17560.1 Uncharacterised protein [Mycobacterium tuberculosis]CNU82131.1 Uncharacterised protein [Mycobacterium tuberculosis]CNV17167.1 Uncharacterised protein [Mycobacterium tuberculosis]
MVTGAAYSLWFQPAVASGPGRVSATASFSASPAGSSDSGSAHPASANSAVHTTSSAMTSRVRSLPVNRRASCNRCSLGDLGKLTCAMVNRPPNCWLQRWAIAVNVAPSVAGV